MTTGTTPLWREVSAEVATSHLPRQAVDVAVVGAGFTGLTSALLLAREGRKVAVLEAHRVGAGASGATTAKTSLLQGTRLSELSEAHDRDSAAHYLEANRFGMEWLTEFCRARSVPTQRVPAITFAATDKGAAAVRSEYEIAGSLGLPVEFEEHRAEEFITHGAVALPDMLQLDPADVLVALARAFTDAAGTITDHTRVHGIDTDPGGATLHTSAGPVHAEQVVLATGSPILDTGRLTMSLSAERSYLCAYDVPDGMALPAGMYISAETPAISVRAAEVDGVGKLLVGGWGHPTGHETDTSKRLAALDDWAERYYPGAQRSHGWSAQDYHAVTRLPVVEEVPWGDGRVFFAGGYSKWGMAAAPAAAHIINDLLSGREPQFTFGGTARNSTALNTATTSAKAAMAATANLVRAVTGDRTRGPDDSSTLDDGNASPGRDGVRLIGESLVDGKACRVSLLCTHMGGPLAWNDAEKSWDCPLHGSRFTPDGRVIEGPAVDDLPRQE